MRQLFPRGNMSSGNKLNIGVVFSGEILYNYPGNAFKTKHLKQFGLFYAKKKCGEKNE